LEFGVKLLMRFLFVGREAENADTFALIHLVGVAKRARFFGTTRRIVLWIKIKNDALTFEVFKLYRLPVLIVRLKSRSPITFF